MEARSNPVEWARFSFEQWAVDHKYSIEKYEKGSARDPFGRMNGLYVDPKVETAWECYQYFTLETQ